MIVVVGGSVCADVNFFNAPDWSGASLWQWFWRSLYCLYRLVSALADTRQLYIQSQCTYSTCVHIIYPYTPEVPPSCGLGRYFAVSRWARSLRLHKIGHRHNTAVMIRWEYYWHEHRHCSLGHDTIRYCAAILAQASTLH